MAGHRESNSHFGLVTQTAQSHASTAPVDSTRKLTCVSAVYLVGDGVSPAGTAGRLVLMDSAGWGIRVCDLLLCIELRFDVRQTSCWP